MNKKYDINEIKAAARGRGAEILSVVAGINRDQLDGRHHACLKCGGVDRFRFDTNKEFAICNSCFNQSNGDIIAAVQWANNCDFPTAIRAIAEYLGIGCSTADSAPPDVMTKIARQKGITPEALRAYGAVELHGAVVVPMFGPDGSQCSTFTMKPDGGKGLNERGKSAGLFLPVVDGKPRLPQPGEDWTAHEGVKDTARAHMLGYNAFGLPTCKMSQKFVPMLRGVNVTFVPDRDTAGESGAKTSAARAKGVAATVKIATLPAELKDKGGADLRDIIRQPDGEQLVREAIASATTWEPEPIEEPLPGEISIWKDDHRTDIFNGKRFIKMHGQSVRWIGGWESWLSYNGQRWENDSACVIESRAKDVSAALWREVDRAAEKLENGDDNDKRFLATLKGFARSSSNSMGVRNMLTMARSELGIAVSHERFDSDPMLLNVLNGTIDLQTGRLRPHDPHDYLTKVCPVTYNIDADCPLWLKFIDDVTCGDKDLAGYQRRLVGYCLTGSTREQILAFLYGVGANGKSVFIETLLALLGPDFGIRAAPELLMSRNGEAHPTERADLFGKRLVVTSETESNRRLNEPLVKDLTGSDRIRARRMRENFWEFTPTHKVIMVGNHRPIIRNTDNGIWRRIKLIPFTRVFAEAEQDKTLPAKLLAELPGILNWALLGCMEWQASGLGEPEAVTKATADYRDSQDVIQSFVAECCIERPQVRVKAGQLYDRFKVWAEASGERSVGSRSFFEEIGRRFHKVISNGKWYEGIGISGEAE